MIIRKYSKPLAIFLLLNFMNYTFAPIIANAMQAEPSSSFAGADMVDLISGDLNYSVPVFDVPGPEGGYSLKLKYNSGIRPAQDASWVGLGWNLDVGAISRSVKGVPDDFAGEIFSAEDVGDGHGGAMNGDQIARWDINEPTFIPFLNSGDEVSQYGVLHGHLSYSSGNPFTTLDCHAIPSEEGLGVYSSAEMVDGGSVPTYDNYYVSSNGISGAMEPVVLENASFYRTSGFGPTGYPQYTEVDKDYKTYKQFTQTKQFFRFKKEFANNFTANSITPFSFNSPTSPASTVYTNSLGYTPSYPEPNGYNSSSMRLAGGNHIEYFLNSEITSGTAKNSGFINYTSDVTSNRTNITFNSINGNTTYNVTKRVGGFSITTKDGTTYHYALPVYTYGKVTKYSSNNPECGPYGDAYRFVKNDAPYAYAWLLTSITGVDYIDKNNDGFAGEEDLGMWINFNYGKLTDKFFQSSPFLGRGATHNGEGYVATSFQQVYYLDAVYTRTHTALFPKSGRYDGQDANPTIGSRVLPLKLNSVALLHNDALKTITSGTTISGAINTLKNTNGILETTDLASYPNYISNIIKEFVLNYDYQLCPGSPNSTAPATGSYPANGKLTLTSVVTYGKTGYNADNSTRIAPPTDFSYELSSPASATITITSVPNSTVAMISSNRGTISLSTNPFSIGDIIKFTVSGSVYYAALLKATSSTTYDVMFLGSTMPPLSGSGTATQTKNPPYTYYGMGLGSGGGDYGYGRFAIFSDNWGYFKCDLERVDYRGINTLTRTTSVSSKAVDVWSLRAINTSLGASSTISYESDSYYGTQMTKGQVFNIKRGFKYSTGSPSALIPSNVDYCSYPAINKTSADLFEFTINEELNANTFHVGQKVSIISFVTFSAGGVGGAREAACGQDDFLITSVNPATGVIQGTFINPVSGIKSNPLWSGSTTLSSGYLYHNSSFIVQTSPVESYGGGIRVKNISVKNDESGEEYITSYDYKNKHRGTTSGTTSFEAGILDNFLSLTNSCYPVGSNNDIYPTAYTSSGDVNWQATLQKYNNYRIEVFAKAISNGDFISPGVLYEYAKVSYSGNGNSFLKSQEYQFQPYTWDVIQRVKTNEDYRSTIGTSGMPEAIAMVTIKDYTSAVGNLLSYKELDANGNPVMETKYIYSNTSPSYTVPGRLDRVYHEERLANYQPYNSPSGSKRYMAVVTVHSEYPTFLASVTTTDYLKNLSSTKIYQKYDLYNGQPTEIISKDSYGQYFKEKNIPAYTKSAYANMGLKMNSISSVPNKNMLNQLTATYTTEADAVNFSDISTLSASVTTWSNQWTERVNNSSISLYENGSTAITNDPSTVQDERVWRPQSTYLWKSPKLNTDGSYGDFTDFDWDPLHTLHANWQKVSEITKYDRFSNALEKKDINGNYTSMKLGYNYTYPLTNSNNSNLNEIAYSGAEDINSSVIFGSTSSFGGEVWLLNGTQDNTIAHTGNSSLKLAQGQYGFIYKSRIKSDGTGISMNKKYRASVWVYDNGNNSAQLYYHIQDPSGNNVSTPYEGNITPAAATTVYGASWKLLTIDIPLGSGSYDNYILVVGCSNPSTTAAYFDDFRFHPLSETISTAVYDKLTGLKTWSLDANNLYFRRAYDAKYRPLTDYKETVNGEIKTREHYYNFGK